MPSVRLVCLSDTHNRLTTGSPSPTATFSEAFGAFLAELPHRDKVVVAGNHDFLFEDEPERVG